MYFKIYTKILVIFSKNQIPIYSPLYKQNFNNMQMIAKNA